MDDREQKGMDKTLDVAEIASTSSEGFVVSTPKGWRFVPDFDRSIHKRLTEHAQQEPGSYESDEINLEPYAEQFIRVEGFYGYEDDWVLSAEIVSDTREDSQTSTEAIKVVASGEIRRWRELRDFRGYEKYSNWSVHIAFKHGSGEPVKCDWIKI